MDGFTFLSPTRVLFGWGRLAELPGEAARLGRRPLVVAGRSLAQSGALDALLAALRDAGLAPTSHVGVPPEPDLAALQDCMDAARDADGLIGVGGGSVLDVAKAAAALAGAGGSAADYFAGRPIPERGRPFLAVPTTAGTGSEVTWVSVLTDRASGRKASIRGGAMMPAAALVDPALTVSCPPPVTAASGFDAFVQAVEAYTSRGASPLTDSLAREAARLTARALPVAARRPDDRPAREAMALGSTMAGLALGTSRLGLVHGLAHPIGAATGAAHGLLCGLLLPPVLRFNREAAGEKYACLAEALELAPPGADREDAVDALIAFSEALLREVGLPTRLAKVGFSPADLDRAADEAMESGSTRANPRPVSPADARAVMVACL